MYEMGYKLDFAYQTFAWTSEAGGKAHVHCVIEGFSAADSRRRELFQSDSLTAEPRVRIVPNISPYLHSGPNLAVAGRSTPISHEMPPVTYGSLLSDGGGLVVYLDDYPEGDSIAESYLRRYVGSQELVNGDLRWVIWMPDGPRPGDVNKSSFLRGRLEAVRGFRRNSKNPDTQALADTPYKWFFNSQPDVPYVGIPAQVSENRKYYTVARLAPEVIASNTLYTAVDPDGFLIGLLSSSMFMTWIRTVGGRLKSDLRYAKSIVHNTFPVPEDIPATLRSNVIGAGQRVLDARACYPDATLADLYEPLAMPNGLVSAHNELDRAVDALFAPRRKFATDADRLDLLFERYEALGKLRDPGG
jgi:hypothetical protein